MSDDEYGPALPPHLLVSKDKSSDEKSVSIGPSLPPRFQEKGNRDNAALSDSSGDSDTGIGPQLPPHLKKKKCESDEEEYIGPNIPQDFKQNWHKENNTEKCNIIGPSLPPHLHSMSHDSSNKRTSLSSALSPDKTITSQSDSDEEGIIGPLPSEMSSEDMLVSTAAQFEQRANRMKAKLQGKDDDGSSIPRRESWMTELPDCLGQNIGLKPRTFRANAGPDLSDRSSWTDTPVDRAKKEQKEEESSSTKRKHEDSIQSRKDKKLADEIHKYNKSKRSESLLDMHQEKLKKKKKKAEKSDEPQGRRPFDRETDLQVNRFDDAQRKSIVKKSQQLDSRFSRGKSQFL